MGKLSSNTTIVTSTILTDKQLIISATDNKLKQVENSKLLELFQANLNITAGSTIVTSKLARFIKKLHDYKAGRIFSRAPVITIIGDSILGGIEGPLQDWLLAEFGIPKVNTQTHKYGGNNIDNMLPYIEDDLINSNPDLVIFCEWEAAGTNDKWITKTESCIKLIKARTSADIGIFTWSFGKENVTNLQLGQDIFAVQGNADLNYLRELARVYNCEVFESWGAIYKEALKGTSADLMFNDLVHPSTWSYTNVILPEFYSHFPKYSYFDANNFTYPNENKITKQFFADKLRFKNSYEGSILFGNETNWSITDNCVLSSSNETIVFDIINGIGFELKYMNTVGTLKIELSSDGGSNWIDPSAASLNGFPLQYASSVFNANVFLRPVKHVQVKQNILTNGVLKSGNYSIIVTDITGSNVTVTVRDSGNNILGTFIIGSTELITSNLDFKILHNGENNYWKDAGYPYALNDVFYFTINSNWIDQVDLNVNTFAKVFGLPRADYKVRLTLLSGTCKLFGIDINN